MTQVIMPKMGDGMEEGTLLEWLKNEGDAVKSGEPIASIQTDKATLEMEAPASGQLAGILVQPGATVPVGEPLAAVLKEGEKLPEGWANGEAKGTEGPRDQGTEGPRDGGSEGQRVKEPDEPQQASSAPVPDQSTIDKPQATSANGSRPKASPLAKKLAQGLNVDLRTVEGSGPGGRIVEKDIRAAAEEPRVEGRGLRAEEARAAIPQDRKTAVPGDEVVPLNKLRQITAQRTAQSKQTAPHFYVTLEVDCENLLALRSLYERDGLEKPSINDFIIRACALALRQMPIVNSVYQGDKLLQLGGVSIGMAVALEDGLTVPVLHNADQLSIPEISAKSKELSQKAKENKLSLEELTGGSFSISNMGMLNVDVFAAILNPPNAGILAVGTAKKRAVVDQESGEISVRTRMNITGSFDHRVVDGAVGAKFVNAVRELLEAPARLL